MPVDEQLLLGCPRRSTCASFAEWSWCTCSTWTFHQACSPSAASQPLQEAVQGASLAAMLRSGWRPDKAEVARIAGELLGTLAVPGQPPAARDPQARHSAFVCFSTYEGSRGFRQGWPLQLSSSPGFAGM